MKKVVRYVSRLLDSQNRQLLNQYLGALHGRLEHEWLPGDSRSTDVVFVQTRHQLNDLPQGAKPIAFMPREGSSVGDSAAVIDKPHLIQTFARNLNRSAGQALVLPHDAPANAEPLPVQADVDYIASAWERAANSSAWPEFVDSVAAAKQAEKKAKNAAQARAAGAEFSDSDLPSDSQMANSAQASVNKQELRRALSPLSDYASGLVTAFTSAAECMEHVRRMGWPLAAISAPQGWRIFIDAKTDLVYARNAASRPFSGHARFLSVLRGACQVMPLSKSAFAEETRIGEAQSYPRFAWELGLAQSERLLPWLPADGVLKVSVEHMPAGITLNSSHTLAMQSLTKQQVHLHDLERMRAPRHALISLINALEMTRALSIIPVRRAAMPELPPTPPIFLRVPQAGGAAK
jgi:hypothetical protein